MKKILFIARDDGGCGFYRMRQPAAFLKRIGAFDTKVVQNQADRQDLMDSDLVVFQEMGSVTGSNIARFCTDHGIPYVAEVDDFLHHVSPHNVHGYPAWNPSTLYVYRAMELIKNAVAMTVSTNQLYREYFPYNKNIYVVPNYLDKEKWDHPMTRRNDGKIRIGWAGGNAHADDLRMISKVLEKVIKEHKGKVVFETMGMTRQELAGVFPMPSGLEDPCPSCGFEGELHHYPGEALNDYPGILASKGWDIALAPVLNNAFGNCKSDLKIKEYSAIGFPVIASPVQPYTEAAKDGASIVFADTFEEWYTAINGLIKRSKERDQMVRHNKEWVNRYWIQENVAKIAEVYGKVIHSSEAIFGTKENRLKKLNLIQ